MRRPQCYSPIPTAQSAVSPHAGTLASRTVRVPRDALSPRRERPGEILFPASGTPSAGIGVGHATKIRATARDTNWRQQRWRWRQSALHTDCQVEAYNLATPAAVPLWNATSVPGRGGSLWCLYLCPSTTIRRTEHPRAPSMPAISSTVFAPPPAWRRSLTISRISMSRCGVYVSVACGPCRNGRL